MDMFRIEGGRRLTGQVGIDGAKNAALPVMAATIVTRGPVTLRRIPQLADVETMCLLLRSLGAEVHWNSSAPEGGEALQIDTSHAAGVEASYELVSRMRAGVCVLGPLLARHGRARVSLPGGCQIGHRPVDLHLHGLAALGADLHVRGGYIVGTAGRLQGCDIVLSGPGGSTVTGTCNVMTAACLARGKTVIQGAAREPEVVDLARFLNSAGGSVQGAGTSVIEINGVSELHSAEHTIIGDRIEAATLAIAAAITGGELRLQNAPVADMTSVLDVLRAAGVVVRLRSDGCDVRSGPVQALRPVQIIASPYPGIPTDTQAQLMALLTVVPGVSLITDQVFPDRFMHVAELIRMGAEIRVQSGTARIQGIEQLTGATVMASDLRASAALVLAALAAEGISEVRRVYHLDRGYVRFEQKLRSLGACIERLSDSRP